MRGSFNRWGARQKGMAGIFPDLEELIDYMKDYTGVNQYTVCHSNDAAAYYLCRNHHNHHDTPHLYFLPVKGWNEWTWQKDYIKGNPFYIPIAQHARYYDGSRRKIKTLCVYKYIPMPEGW